MKVYIVFVQTRNIQDIISVYTSYEKAFKHAAEINKYIEPLSGIEHGAVVVCRELIDES